MNDPTLIEITPARLDEAERMANDVQLLMEQMSITYSENGKEPPPPMRLLMMAQCAWTATFYHGMQARAAREAKNKPRIVRPDGGNFK